MILDTNIVIAVIDPESPDIIRHTINALRVEGEMYINEIVFAELSRSYRDVDDLAAMLDAIGVGVARLTLAECHCGGQAFAEYRRRGGTRTTILPDFLIGAQAEARGWPLVTRDRKGFASYFPELTVIDPLEDPA